MKKLILASASPRRFELMSLLNYPFEVVIPLNEEVVDETLSLRKQVENLALDKATEVFTSHTDAIVIAADTVIQFESTLMGKPHTEKNAFKMLKKLQGETHEVITAVAILSSTKTIIFSEVTEVTFNPMSDQEIKEYIDTKEPLDKAGAYTIQEKGALFIQGIKGDFYTVMGLPISKVYQILKDDFKLYNKDSQ